MSSINPMHVGPVKDDLRTLVDQLIDPADPDHVKMSIMQKLDTISKENCQLFTEDMMEDIVAFAKYGGMSIQPMLLMVIDQVCRNKPEVVVKQFDVMMDEDGWDKQYGMINTIITTFGLYDKRLSDTVIDYQIDDINTNQHKVTLFTGLESIRVIGYKYPDVIKLKRQDIENLNINDGSAQTLKKSILDMIDGNTPDELKRQLETQKGRVGTLEVKVDDMEEAVVSVQEEVTQHGQRLDQVEETVEETAVRVETIDSKTLSHAPYWSRDISRILNPPTEHDWRLLSSRLGYSNGDIRGWAQQADPCMALLNEWYATRKTSEATVAILTNLQEMSRLDAALIVENAMKQAEAVVEDEEFVYSSPPPIFISYQWGHQQEVKLLQRHLAMAGYDCWLDIGQMGGGDKLFDKIDNGLRAAKVVISCVTSKYAKSPNCNREVNLAIGVKKPIIPLLLENCPWPPQGSMGPIFSESLYIQFFKSDKGDNNDGRYWQEDKFHELLMQLSANGLTPDESKIEPLYRDWWIPLQEEIKIDRRESRNGDRKDESKQTEADIMSGKPPDVFISYQWGNQKNVLKLYQRLTSLGFSCWLDIKQMGGGDALYDKLDRGIRQCKVVLSCVTKNYALSANCRREVSLADALKKPLLPLLFDDMSWPPPGAMSLVMTQLLYIDFHKVSSNNQWDGPQLDELISKINDHLPKSLTPKTNDMNKEGAIQEPRSEPVATNETNPKPQRPASHRTIRDIKPGLETRRPTTAPAHPQAPKSKSCSIL